jgi:hypothetical protein
VDATGKRITVTATESMGTPRSESFVTMANLLSICGKNNWVNNAASDLTNTPCIGWSESNSTDGINLIDTSQGNKQIQVISIGSDGTKQRAAGDDFTRD